MRVRGQMASPSVEFGVFDIAFSRRAELVELHDHGLVDPAEQFHLGLHVHLR